MRSPPSSGSATSPACGTRSSAPTRTSSAQRRRRPTATPASGGPSLTNVDAIFFMGHRDVPLDAAQKAELLQFVRDGRGFVAAHVALTAFESWPEFLDSDRRAFRSAPDRRRRDDRQREPGSSRRRGIFRRGSPFNDEFYQPKEHLAREDRRAAAAGCRTCRPTRLHLNGDYPLVWAKTYGKGRVFYSLARPRGVGLGYSRRAADVLRGDPMGARPDRRRAAAASDARERGSRAVETRVHVTAGFSRRPLRPNGGLRDRSAGDALRRNRKGRGVIGGRVIRRRRPARFVEAPVSHEAGLGADQFRRHRRLNLALRCARHSRCGSRRAHRRY